MLDRCAQAKALNGRCSHFFLAVLTQRYIYDIHWLFFFFQNERKLSMRTTHLQNQGHVKFEDLVWLSSRCLSRWFICRLRIAVALNAFELLFPTFWRVYLCTVTRYCSNLEFFGTLRPPADESERSLIAVDSTSDQRRLANNVGFNDRQVASRRRRGKTEYQSTTPS